MSNERYGVTQEYRVLKPESGEAYPIPCREWDLLKSRIANLSHSLNIFMEAGSLFVGVSLSTLITILIGTFSQMPEPNIYLAIAWILVIATAILAVGFIGLAATKAKIKKTQAEEIISQMEVIESRYPRKETTEPRK